MKAFRFALFVASLAMLSAPASARYRTTQISLDGTCHVLTLFWYEQTVGATFAGDNCPTGLGTGLVVTDFPHSVRGHFTTLGVRFDGDDAAYYVFLSHDYRHTGHGGYEILYTTNGLGQGSIGGTYSPVKNGVVEKPGRESITSRVKRRSDSN